MITASRVRSRRRCRQLAAQSAAGVPGL